MLNTSFTSNVHIDAFIEKLALYSVKPEDISIYLDYSIQFETNTEVNDKIAVLEHFFLEFKTKYPDLSQQIEEEINEVYSKVIILVNDNYEDVYAITERLTKEFGSRFHELEFRGTFFDLGREIGVLIGKYFNNDKFGTKKDDFFAGLDDGIKIYEG